MTQGVAIKIAMLAAGIMAGIMTGPALDLVRGEAGLTARVERLEVQDNKGDRWTAEQQREYTLSENAFKSELVDKLHNHVTACSGRWIETKTLLTVISDRLGELEGRQREVARKVNGN